MVIAGDELKISFNLFQVQFEFFGRLNLSHLIDFSESIVSKRLDSLFRTMGMVRHSCYPPR